MAGNSLCSRLASSIFSICAQSSPASSARVRYSTTVEWLVLQARAVLRAPNSKCHSSLKMSRVFRIGSLLAGILWPPLGGQDTGSRGGPCGSLKLFRSKPTSDSDRHRPSGRLQPGFGGRLAPDSVVAFPRNRWSACLGICNRVILVVAQDSIGQAQDAGVVSSTKSARKPQHCPPIIDSLRKSGAPGPPWLFRSHLPADHDRFSAVRARVPEPW